MTWGPRGERTKKPPLDLGKEAKLRWLGPVREVARGARATGGSGAGGHVLACRVLMGRQGGEKTRAARADTGGPQCRSHCGLGRMGAAQVWEARNSW